MPDSSFDIEEAGDVTVVGFRDASILDALTIQRISRELYDLVEGQGKRKIVLDFKDVRFLSSGALGMLLTLRRKADKAGAKVVLCRIRPELARVFNITNLDKMFDFFGDRESAVAHLGGPPAGEDRLPDEGPSA